MSEHITYRKFLKQLVRNDEWGRLGKMFDFKPLYIETQRKRRNIIDWCCVPASLYSLLQKENNHIPFPDNFDKTLLPKVEKLVERKQIVRVDVKGYDVRQLEHFGDAIVNLASRKLAADKKERYHYFLSAQRLASNINLKTAGFVSGDAFEVAVGTVFVERGATAALKVAIKLLKQTEHYKMIYENR